MFSGGGDVAGDGGGLGVRMAIGPEPDVAAAHQEVAGLALVLAGGAGRVGFELRPCDIAWRDVPAWRDASLDKQDGPVGLRHRSEERRVGKGGRAAGRGTR